MENNDADLTPPVSKQEDRYDKFKRAEELVKLGEKSSDARKRRKAIAYYKEAAAIFKEIEGEKSIKLASVYGSIACNCLEIKNYEEMLNYVNRALEIFESEMSGAYNEDWVICYATLGHYYRELGNPKKSIYYYEKSLEILGEENDMELRFAYTLMSEFEKAKLKNAHGDNEEKDSNQP